MLIVPGTGDCLLALMMRPYVLLALTWGLVKYFDMKRIFSRAAYASTSRILSSRSATFCSCRALPSMYLIDFPRMKDRPRERNFWVLKSMGVGLDGLRIAHRMLAWVRDGRRNCRSIKVRVLMGMHWFRSSGAIPKREGHVLRLACLSRVR